MLVPKRTDFIRILRLTAPHRPERLQSARAPLPRSGMSILFSSCRSERGILGYVVDLFYKLHADGPVSLSKQLSWG